MAAMLPWLWRPWHLHNLGTSIIWALFTSTKGAQIIEVSLYMVSYNSIIEMKSLSLAVFEIFAKITFWPLDLGPRSKVMAPNESPYMVSYMSTIEMKSLSLVVFEIFAKIAFWPLDLGPRSKVMAPNESPHMVSYMTVMKMESLTLVVREIFQKK